MAAPARREVVAVAGVGRGASSRPPACPCCGAPVGPALALAAVSFHAMRRPLSERAADRRAALAAEVASRLARDPGMSANEIVRALRARGSAPAGFRRADVLSTVKTLRTAARAVPALGNRADEEGRG